MHCAKRIEILVALVAACAASPLFAQQQLPQYNPAQRQYGPQQGPQYGPQQGQYGPQQGAQQPAQFAPQGAQPQRGPIAGPPAPGQGQPRPAPQAPFQLTAQQHADLDKVLSAWEEKSGAVSTLRVEFTLYEYDPVFGPKDGSAKRKANGEIRYASPDKGSYVVEGADGEHWVCDGNAIYEYESKKKQLIERRLPKELQGKAIADGPMPFMFGASKEKLKQRYFMRLLPPTDPATSILIEAFPRYRQDAANFSKVEILLSKSTMMPSAIGMHLPNGQSRNTYVFDPPTVNNTLDRLQKGWIVAPTKPIGWTKVIEEVPAAGDNPAPEPRQAQLPQIRRR